MKINTTPLAIVGMSCLFPKADDLQAYWANIKSGVDAITPIPLGSHWNPSDYFDADPKSPDHTYAQRGGFLSPVSFNPMEFGISPKDIEATDTTQLLSLLGAQQALVNAGYEAGSTKGRGYDRERTSVILGVTGALELVIPLGARLGHPHWRRALKDAGVEPNVAEDVVQRISDSYVGWQENSFPGLLGNVAAGRIASRLDLGGTNCVVDAACASSLAAIHLAGLELATGRSDMVITGGVDTFNDIFMYMCFSKTPALSPTGDAKPFSQDCDGTVLGEGLGMLVLKRLEDAERDGDRIYAVLKGTASSSDGRSSAIYAPRADGQKLALQRAYEISGVKPESIGLLEAHGTGTKVGDATELSSLTEVFRAANQPGSWCALGSVKSQIGHTKAAAGVAGIIKAAMALHQKVLPPSIKVSQPLEGAAPGLSPFYVNTIKRPWLPSGAHPRRAGVSALGFGGTNFHCVLEEHGSNKPAVDWDGDVEILAFSNDSLGQLKDQIAAHDAKASWPDFRRAAWDSRQQFRLDGNFRLLVAVNKDSDRIILRDTALRMLESNPDKASWMSPTGIVFGSGKPKGKIGALFPGQGSQYVGMLRDLACQFPAMLNALTAAQDVFAGLNGKTGDPQAPVRGLSEFIYPHPAFSKDALRQQEDALKSTDIAQPALGAVSVGALDVLTYFGVKAQAVCGHSYGELSALSCAGRIKPEELHRLSNLRGRLMAAKNDGGDFGSMIAVQADEQTVLGFLRESGAGAGGMPLVMANRNSPKQFVLAGPTAGIETAAQELASRSIRATILPVSAAFHSSLVADSREPFAQALEAVAIAEGEIPVYANSTGQVYPKDSIQARDVLANQIVQPVNFMDQILAMADDGVRTFVEVGPGHVLCDLVQAILPGGDVEAIALDASKGKRSGIFDLALALSRIASLGHQVNLTQWENVPTAAEAGAKKSALKIALTGANYRAPHLTRAPAKPVARAALDAIRPDERVRHDAGINFPDRSVESKAAQQLPPQSEIMQHSSKTTDPDVLSSAFRAAKDGIIALQRLQEQTAQLHKQFLEGQESARRAIQSLLGLQGGMTHQGLPAQSPSTVSTGIAVSESQSLQPLKQASREPLGALADQPAPNAVVQNRSGSLPAGATASAAPDRSRYEQAVLQVVSDKTGYPVEMLTLDMGMDSDLGVDSIKRVEIMATLRGSLPEAPEIKPEHLGSLQTLDQVVAFLAGGASVAPAESIVFGNAIAASAIPISASAVQPVEKIGEAVLSVVADKTGYPVEMLTLDMGMDTDLGIDSIKRVEIMASLRGLLPDAPEIKPEHLGSLQTLEQVVAFLSGGNEQTGTRDAAAKAATTAGKRTAIPIPPSGFSSLHVSQVLLAVVAEKTGYPAEMLNLDMGMDSDLGIDSIKRVEIMASLRTQLPGSPEIKPEQLGSLQTLQQIVDFLAGNSGIAMATSVAEMIAVDGAPAADALPGEGANQPAGIAESLAITQSVVNGLNQAGSNHADQDPVVRQVVRKKQMSSEETRDTIGLPKGALVWLTDDGSLLSSRIEGRLRAKGLNVLRGDINQKGFGNGGALPAALVIVAPAAGSKDSFLRQSFRLMQLASPSLRRAGMGHQGRAKGRSIFVTISRLDGAFGFDSLGDKADLISGGLAGLVKTAHREWPEVHCKAIDLNPENLQIEEAAEEIVAEIFRAGPLEVGLSGRKRVSLEVVSVPLRATSSGAISLLNQGDVVIISGGARGVTGEAALELAKAFRPTLVLLGRSELAESEPVWLQDLNSEAEIKKALFARAEGNRSPKTVEAKYIELLARREIRTQIARLEAAGARAIYRAVDVRDGLAVSGVISEIRLRHGAIRGLIHGAGVLADRRIEDKTDEQFESVYGTKVAGLQNLLGAIAGEELKAMVFFSSYTGRYGRVGQVDYAAANEVLNKIAQSEARGRRGCRVLSVNWGPWNGGMVTPGLRKIFEAEGVGLIEPADGAEFLVRELLATDSEDVEVLAIARPTLTVQSDDSHPPQDGTQNDSSPRPGMFASGNMPALGESAIAFEREVSVRALPCLESHVLNGRAVLPAALMVEWLAQAALHGNPGMAFHGLDNFKVLKGLVLEADQSVNVSLHAGEGLPRANLLAVAVRMSSRSGGRLVLHAEAEVLLTTEKLPVAPAPALNNVSDGGFKDAYTRGVLFHGADLHGIQSVEGCTEQGVAATVRGAPSPRKWIRNPLRGTWIADPLALDSAFQMMILWSSAHRAAPSLPSALARYRQFVSAFPKSGCRVVIGVALGISAMAVATIEFLDSQGNLLAAAEGCECVVDASLSDAFRLNRLGLEK